jgi:hypothetical protein
MIELIQSKGSSNGVVYCVAYCVFLYGEGGVPAVTSFEACSVHDLAGARTMNSAGEADHSI